MTVKEFYLLLPSASRNIMSVINQYVVNNMWTGQGGVTAQNLTDLSQNIVIYNADRELSPMIIDFINLNGFDVNNLSAANVQSIMRFLYVKYQDKWSKLWEYIYLQDYNPIWNVDGTESIVRTFEHGKTTTNTITSDITQNSRNAFNSATPKDTDKSSTTGSNSSVDSGCDTERVTNTRGGNIGTVSTQNMLEQELSLREKFNYFVVVMTDIINELSLRIY